MVISIIGGSGSGKDTQAAFVAEKYGIPHVSMGNIMREQERLGNPLAIQAQEIANQGNWVPDEITSALLEDYLKKNCDKGFVLTGYPRPVEQIRSFDRILKKLDLPLTAVIHIEVPDDILMARMRAQVEEAAQKGDQRGDTDEVVMRKRLESYHNTIRPLLNEYFTRGILINVDGTPSREEVRNTIFTELDQLANSKK